MAKDESKSLWSRIARFVIGGSSSVNAEKKDEPVVLKGAIDGLEGDWALIAFDDEQRLAWPRERLPEGAKEGMAIILDLNRAAEMRDRESTGTWEGTVRVQALTQGPSLRIQLGKQSLKWPVVRGLSSGEPVVMRMHIDVEGTEQRRQRVKALLDDLFE